MDLNTIFQEQAMQLDNTGKLKEITNYIINNNEYNLFLLQVISNNLTNSINKKITDSEQENAMMIQRLAMSLNSKSDIKKFKDFLPENKYSVLKNILEKFSTKEFAEKIITKFGI